MRSLLIFFVLLFCSTTTFSQVTGIWISIDDNSGEPRSIIEIVEQSGKYFGKVVKIFAKPGEPNDPVCDKCDAEDNRFKMKIIGMEILRNAAKEGSEFTGGSILDPENGKVYRCKFWLEGGNLKLRGYWGPFFRTQTWKRESVHP